jgi:hypothetical protein
LESRDVSDVTPLMMAVETIAGESTIHGFPADHAVIDILLRSGANKDATDRDGLTVRSRSISSFIDRWTTTKFYIVCIRFSI